jgi:hypothetical protein
MDLRLHLMVLWRFRVLICAGIVVGALLALLALYSPHAANGLSLTPREPSVWVSSTKLLVTQAGFPWGRSVLPGVDPSAPPVADDDSESSRSGTRYAEPARLSYLANIYSHFLTSDEVLTLIPDPPPGMSISAQPVRAGGSLSAGQLPLIALDAAASSAQGAGDLSRKATAALERYIHSSQTAEKVPDGQRVVVRVMDNTAAPVQLQGLPMSKAFVAFSVALALAVALAYVLENLRPRTAGEFRHDGPASMAPFGPLPPTYPNGQRHSPASSPESRQA